ncbi:MAG: hypothetical protein AAF557_19780 [Pseudomonadota bacterium]
MWTWTKHRRRRIWAFAFIAFAAPSQAISGAWTLAEDTTLAIVTTSYKIAPVSSLASGIRTRDELTTQVFLETGVFDDLTLGLTAYSDFSRLTGETDTRLGLHARQRLWQGWNGSIVSVQVGFELPANEWIGQLHPEDSVLEFDARALFGTGWQLDWANSYISTELGYRVRRGGLADELRFDGTAGLEPWDGILGLFTVSADVPLGGTEDASLEITPSLAFTLWPLVGENDKRPDLATPPQTLQIGVGIDALNPDDGIRISGGIWTWF